MHHQSTWFLAQGDAGPLVPGPPRPSSVQQLLGSPEFLLIVGLAAALTVAVFVWALVIRKRRPTDPHQRALEGGDGAESGSKAGHRRHRHRRRHRGERSREHRNPTLQETGGLPPPRPEDELPRI